jgi:hypothetical protein
VGVSRNISGDANLEDAKDGKRERERERESGEKEDAVSIRQHPSAEDSLWPLVVLSVPKLAMRPTRATVPADKLPATQQVTDADGC